MTARKWVVVCLGALIMGGVLAIAIMTPHVTAEPGFDQGCYCHNNGVSVFINGSGDGEGGVFEGPITAGSSFHLLATTNDSHVTGIVPGIQRWDSNMTDNAKFTISPQQVAANSTHNLSKLPGNITALYAITAPQQAGSYTLTLYAQGTYLQPIAVDVVAAVATNSTTTTTSTTITMTTTTPTMSSTTSTTTTTTTISTTTSTPTITSTTTTTTPTVISTPTLTTTSSTSSSTSLTSPSTTTTSSSSSRTTTTAKVTSQNMLAGFPGLNLITLYVTSAVALVFGVLLGVGVAFRARKTKTGS